jgi:hypothetical protein
MSQPGAVPSPVLRRSTVDPDLVLTPAQAAALEELRRQTEDTGTGLPGAVRR